MFKKSFESKSQQRLSGADRKKLRRSVKDKFPNASDSDIDLILPPKTEVTVSKLPNRVLVYSVEDGFPMFFDVDGRGNDIFPTVYALWKVPELLPAFMLKGGEVSHFIIGGADLMFPGISIPEEGLPSFKPGESWAVKVPGNAAPFAVGTTTMSSSEALKAGLRGKALRITHTYGDSLWASVEGLYVPNAGFLQDVVLADPCGDISSTPRHQIDLNGEGADHGNAHQEQCIDTPVDSEIKQDIPEEIVSGTSGLKLTEDAPVEAASEKDQHEMSSAEVDSLLDKCLLQALYTTVKDKDLPIPGSTLWSGHVLPCRPSGMTLDIKKSSHKKLSKWLQSKSSSGLISAKEDKHKKEVVLTGVNRTHPDYTSFRPEKRQPEPVNPITNTNPNEVRPNLELLEVYKPSVHVNPIFTSLGLSTSTLYTAAEANEIVFKYVENQNLVKPSQKAIVILDAILCEAIFKGAIKKGSTYPTEIHKKDLGPAFVGRMQAHHSVTRGNETIVRKGALKTVQILTERRQGNKKMTRVSGLESFLIDAELLASELQKKFACSTTTAELPGKKGYEVLVQGGVIEDLGKHLVEQYGVPKRYIEVYDKTRK
ncbi:hypothetical protein ACHQM5_016607 [Ranunculus cassubicifolius]